jgi:hypothetical protein
MSLDFRPPLLELHAHQSSLPVKVGTKTTPLPMFRLVHQSALHRVPVHVAQFLNVLMFRPHVEIVKAFLPHRSRFEVRSPTHRKGRDEWGTRHLPRTLRDIDDRTVRIESSSWAFGRATSRSWIRPEPGSPDYSVVAGLSSPVGPSSFR